MANKQKSFRSQKVINTLFGSKANLFKVFILLLLLSWFADLTLELFKGDWQDTHLWFIVTVVLVLFILYLILNDNEYDAIHQLQVIEPNSTQYKTLIYSLSYNKEDIIQKFQKLLHSQKQQDEKKQDIIEYIQKSKSNYLTPYKILDKNSKIEYLCLIISHETYPHVSTFQEIIQLLFPHIKCYTLGKDFSTNYPKGISFSDLEKTYDVYEKTFQFITKEIRIKNKNILTDLTGGTVINSIAGAAIIAEFSPRAGVILNTTNQELQYFNINAEG